MTVRWRWMGWRWWRWWRSWRQDTGKLPALAQAGPARLDGSATGERLVGRGGALLAGFALALLCVPVVVGPTLSGHQSVQAQTSREMLASGNWLIPTIGGDAWLERPPVPMWWIALVYRLAGTDAHDGVARLAAVLAAVPIVLMVAAIAARFYGRSVGLLSGALLATMQEFYYYAANPEADIFLCVFVTAAIACFVWLEFDHGGQLPSEAARPYRFWGGREWPMAGLFVLLGATNWAKGLLFGTAMAALPLVAYLVWTVAAQRSWRPLSRYVWLWGWLLAAAAALAWPLAVLGRYPEIVQLWQEHYLGRLHRGYLREPWWYYAVQLPYVMLPWTPLALVGLAVTWRAAWRRPGPERFLWCWGLTPPLVFSLADGKHHHYLLQCLAPWAILAAVGARPAWEWCRRRFGEYRWLPGGLAAGVAALWVPLAAIVGPRIPGGLPVAIGFGTLAVLMGFVAGQAMLAATWTRAVGAAIAGTVMTYAAWTAYQGAMLDDYRHDLAFLRAAEAIIPPDRPVLVQYDWTAPLETFWVLYHLRRPGVLIRDPWQAAEKGETVAYILARRMDAAVYSQTGSVAVLLESAKSRSERHPSQRRVLYRLKLASPLPPAPTEYLRATRRTLW